jgi:heme oxygenase (biliverdin-IX-beta and delta-forming)
MLVVRASHRRQMLKASTFGVHQALETAIEKAQFFGSLTGYCDWVRRSYAFHWEMDAAIAEWREGHALPVMGAAKLASLLSQDAEDLGINLAPAVRRGNIKIRNMAEVLGALYVVHGASLGARILTQRARKLGLTAGFGARQLEFAASSFEPWRDYLNFLEDYECPDSDEKRMAMTARETFELAKRHFSVESREIREDEFVG